LNFTPGPSGAKITCFADKRDRRAGPDPSRMSRGVSFFEQDF
jgi:hypothetical protein